MLAAHCSQAKSPSQHWPSEPMANKYRGGHRQKRRKLLESMENGDTDEDDLAAAPVFPSTSSLATSLLMRWGEGQLSAADVQHLAHSAVQDGATHPELTWLASLGAHGLHPGNVTKALKAKYLANPLTPEAYLVHVPMYTTRDRTAAVDETIAVLLPHEWFGCMATSFEPCDFAEQFGLSGLTAWWSRQDRNNPKFQNHPLLAIDNWDSKVIPLALHADGAQFQERDSLLTVSFRGLLFSRTSKKDAHLLTASLPKSVTTNECEDEMWAVMQWSLQCLLGGKYPCSDHRGQAWPAGSMRGKLANTPLHPDGYRGVLWGVCGDLDFYSKDMGLPHPGAAKFCFRCHCDRQAVPWTDFRDTAAWRETVLTAEDLMQTTGCKLSEPESFNCIHVT